jgi:hypothetical protein
MKTLYIPVKGEYFHEIQGGTKTEEFRLDNENWQKKLIGRDYDNIVITLGYPKKDDASRRLEFPYRGYSRKTITHPHFGPKPVAVFAIMLRESSECSYCKGSKVDPDNVTSGVLPCPACKNN